MSILVVNCFHWIGYHIVNNLLESGEEVDGIDDIRSTKKEQLSMFFGRNSSFAFIANDEMRQYDTSIIVGDYEYSRDITAKRQFRISINGRKNETGSNQINIRVPLLFGEWMPMNEKGMYQGETFIPFDSESFLTKAIYVKDFVEDFINQVYSTNLPAELRIKSLKSKEKEEQKLDNFDYLHDNVPIEVSLEAVLEHYRQHKEMY